MPSVSSLLSGTVSVSVMVGMFSGLFYLVVAGLKWAGKLRAALQEEEEAREAELARQRRLNERACVRCRQPFSFLVNKRLTCEDCGFNVCRNCCEWDRSKAVFVCNACIKEREVKLQSGQWFYDQLHRRFNGFGSVKSSTGSTRKRSGDNLVDADTAEVREFIEKLVEALVGGGLDNVNVNKLYSHPEYERMLSTYHGVLCEAIARLSFALQMSLNNKPVPEEDSPTVAHTALKQLVQEVLHEAMGLPSIQGVENGIAPAVDGRRQLEDEDCSTRTYEDILATAIINKVVERFQKDPDSTMDSNRNVLDNLRANMDSYLGTTIEDLPKFINRVEVGIQSSLDDEEESESRDVSSLDMASPEDEQSWSESSGIKTDPLSFTIEERIEEVTTTEDAPENSELPEEPAVRKSIVHEESQESELDYYFSGLNFIESHKVPFPELGMDIVDGSDSDDEANDPATLVTPMDTWEENWLFQKRRLKKNAYPSQDPVPMLVPNPSEDYRAKIGDKDVDETSDLSEYNSQDEHSISTEDEDDEDPKSLEAKEDEITEARNLDLHLSGDLLTEFGQQDHEYTEDYAAVDQRRFNSLSRIPDKPVPKPRTHVGKTADGLTVPKFCPVGKRKPSPKGLIFSVPPESPTIHAGKAVRFFCKAQGNKPIRVAWYYGDILLEPGDNYKLYSLSDCHYLEIYNTEPKISGTYSCVAFNYEGATWHDFQLTIRASRRAEASPEFIKEPEAVSVEEGGAAVFYCEVAGYPEPMLTFWKGAKILHPSDKCIIENQGYGAWILKLKHVRPDEDGHYSIEARNKFGSITSQAILTVSPKDAKQVHSLEEGANRLRNGVYQQAEELLVSANQLTSLVTQLDELDSHLSGLEEHMEGELEPQGVQSKYIWSEEEDSIQKHALFLRDTLYSLQHEASVVSAMRETTGEVLDIITSTEEAINKLNQPPTINGSNQKKKKKGSKSKSETTTSENTAVMTNGTSESPEPPSHLDAPPRPGSNPSDAEMLPRPGTIAEREHKKWETAAPLPNNPYSPENIAKRLNKRLTISRPLSAASVEFPEFQNELEKEKEQAPLQINCGGKQVNSKRYGRDYYINVEKDINKNRNEGQSPSQALNNLEEQVYLSAGRVSQLDNKVSQLESEVTQLSGETTSKQMETLEDRVAQTAAQVYNSDRQVSRVECEVARLQREINETEQQWLSSLDRCRTRQLSSRPSMDESLFQQGEPLLNGHSSEAFRNGISEASSVSSDSELCLPSVKELARQFSTAESTDSSSSARPSTISKAKKKEDRRPSQISAQNTSSNALNKDIVIVEKCEDQEKKNDLDTRPTRVVREVHSLTARSISREFREGLRRNLPFQPNRNILQVAGGPPVIRDTPSPEHLGIPSEKPPFPPRAHDETPGYTSDESATSPTPAQRRAPPRRKVKSNIASKAAFWDRRVELGQLSDHLVTEDFPDECESKD